MKQRVGGLWLLAAVSLFLGGCSSMPASMKNQLLKQSGISENEDYRQYENLQKNESLNEEGEYFEKEEDDETSSIQKGKVHITFGRNSYLEISYYADAEETVPLDENNCYLNPGDTIYAKVNSSNPNTNQYDLDAFVITPYDAEGNPGTSFNQSLNGNIVFQIPYEFSEAELNLIPLGRYEDRTLNLKGYVIDDSGKVTEDEKSLLQWYINNESCSPENAVVSPYEEYTVSFSFDRDHYYVDHTEPSLFTPDVDIDTKAEFHSASALDETSDYSVWLRECVNLAFQISGENRKYTIYDSNDCPEETVTVDPKDKNDWIVLSKLQDGQKIVVTTDGNCKVKYGVSDHIIPSRQAIDDAYQYTFLIDSSQESKEKDFTDAGISVVKVFHVELNNTCVGGTCSFKLDGDLVSGITDIAEGQTLKVECDLQDGYEFVGRGVNISAENLVGHATRTVPGEDIVENATVSAGDYFDISIKEDAASEAKEVTLDSSYEYGTVTFRHVKNWVQKTKVQDGSVMVYDGQSIEITCKLNEKYEFEDGSRSRTVTYSYEDLSNGENLSASEIFQAQEITKVSVYLDPACDYGTCTFSLKTSGKTLPITEDHVDVHKGEKLIVTCPQKEEDQNFFHTITNYFSAKDYQIKFEELTDHQTVHASDYCKED